MNIAFDDLTLSDEEQFNRSSVRPASRLRAVLRTIGLCTGCLAGLVTLFIGFQALSLSYTRDHRIIKTLRTAIETGVLTDTDFPISPYGHTALFYDMFTDCIAMSTNLGNEDQPLLNRLAETPYVLPAGSTSMLPCHWVVEDIKKGTIRANQPYFRYWHGHQIYLRPLLANTSLANVHRINAALLIAALSFFIVGMVAQFGIAAAPVILIPLLAGTNILTTPASTVHALTWIWAFFSLGCIARWFPRHSVSAPGTHALVFSLGCVAAFFDVLFSPPFAPTFIAFLAISIGLRRGRTGQAVVDGGLVAFTWFAGFSLSWASKWAFSAAVLGWDAVVTQNVMIAAAVRTFGDREDALHV